MRLLLALVLLAAAALARADEAPERAPLRPEDFAFGLPLIIQPGPAVQTLLLPLEVYRGLRNDRADLSVFDGAGRSVPWALRELVATTAVQREEHAAPIFPLHGAASEGATDLSVQVERAQDGTLISVRTPRVRPERSKAKLLAYIVETGQADRELTGLRFALAAATESTLWSVRVEASDDLNHWQELTAGSQIVGRLLHAGQLVERAHVDLAPTRASYLRIRWDGSEPLPLDRLFVERSADVTRAPSTSATLSLPPRMLTNGSYELDLGGNLALIALVPRFATENVLLPATLYAGDEAASRHLVFAGQLYRLSHDGSTLESGPVALAHTRARFLRLSTDAHAVAPPRELGFDVSYAPEQLLFVPHGSEPHLLAFGSYRAEGPPFRAEQLLAPLSTAQQAKLPLASARVGQLRKLSGELARKAPPPPRSYRRAVLWSVLTAGALTMVLLALRLLAKTRRG